MSSAKEPTKFKRYGFAGIFEDYSKRSVGPAFQIYMGLDFDPIKGKIFYEVDPQIRRIDPFYHVPSRTCFSPQTLETGLCLLYTLMAHEIERAANQFSTLSMWSVLDAYAEIVYYHNRQKWLEPLVKRHIQSYDLIVFTPNSQGATARKGSDKYESIVRRLMHDFKGNYVIGNAIQHVQRINGDFKAHHQIHREQAQPSSGDSKTSAAAD